MRVKTISHPRSSTGWAAAEFLNFHALYHTLKSCCGLGLSLSGLSNKYASDSVICIHETSVFHLNVLKLSDIDDDPNNEIPRC